MQRRTHQEGKSGIAGLSKIAGDGAGEPGPLLSQDTIVGDAAIGSAAQPQGRTRIDHCVAIQLPRHRQRAARDARGTRIRGPAGQGQRPGTLLDQAAGTRDVVGPGRCSARQVDGHITPVEARRPQYRLAHVQATVTEYGIHARRAQISRGAQ